MVRFHHPLPNSSRKTSTINTPCRVLRLRAADSEDRTIKQRSPSLSVAGSRTRRSALI
ncbi:hypothetical protein AAS21_gp098 [Pantoea phage vB_PagS_AAS21]|uniref:Uncharacterized protein n=1 Tax=Pantoea phage vB_PagS_AAS21 TaxID=2575261 RepID=A0A4Y5P1K6_9CAUD|nr:hypothetical protein AAS21_gp098 [Pantoea phage vB_PagS_AAS21]